ncbi:glycosyltransferase family 39 protein, partial [Candidatus Pacearchaeota archaeon]|nr:glycosyltransferase family 39 protein [Candidatus Pacearchaeota archaeon]
MNKKIIFFLLIVLIFLGILFRGFSLNNEISAEESDFIMPATAVANTGHPTFYHSESQPKETALWHPPMYILSLSLIIKLFSSNEIPIRFLNIFFSILTSGLIYLFCKNIIGKDRGKIIGLISSAFFMINYYIFSSSIMIDIDGFSAFFILGFIYFLLRNYQTKKKTYYYFAVVFLFFSIWNRYPIAFLVY